jgi:quercetin dioxygenase-like cupin family protein
VRDVSGEVLRLSPNSTLRVLSPGPEALVVEATYERGDPPPPHFHPAQEERFEVLEGAMRVVIDGEERELPAGEELRIPRETVHQMWNPEDAIARVRWETSPPGRTEEFFRGMDEVMPEDDSMPDIEALLAHVARFGDTMRLALP